jgi:hypothetical protein
MRKEKGPGKNPWSFLFAHLPNSNHYQHLRYPSPPGIAVASLYQSPANLQADDPMRDLPYSLIF